MGLSSKKQKTTSNQTATVAPSAYAQPYVDAAAQTFAPAYQEGMDIQRQFQPGLTNAFNYYGDVQSGQYLDGNPHLEGMIDASNENITEAVNQQFMPRFGSGYHAKALAKQLGQNENAMRYGNYAQERGYQDAAGRNMAGLATTATALPSIPSTTYAQNVGGLLGRYNTTTGSGTQTTKQGGGLLDIIGLGLQGASMLSDARLKTDVRRIGKTDGGLSLYSFRYMGSGPFHIGPMAQEVREAQPLALGEPVNGYLTVNYGEVR